MNTLHEMYAIHHAISNSGMLEKALGSWVFGPPLIGERSVDASL